MKESFSEESVKYERNEKKDCMCGACVGDVFLHGGTG